MKKRTMEEWFDTLYELSEEFEEWCYSFLPKIPIYYRRNKIGAECQCGKCGMHYEVAEKPYRTGPSICPLCGNEGFYEWKKVTTGSWHRRDFYILQCTRDKNLVMRHFVGELDYRQGRKANIKLVERKRIFLTMGDVFWFNYESKWCGKDGWKDTWEKGKGGGPMHDGELYAGWSKTIQESNLKYCDVKKIKKVAHHAILNILIAYASNPAIEMYAKSGMEILVDHLIRKEGKTKWINRRGKSIKQQLRLKDGQKIKRFIESKGDLVLLGILQMEEKNKINYTYEQEEFLRKMFSGYYNQRPRIERLLKYMSLQQLMNRVDKYRLQLRGYSTNDVIGKYDDYLQMRKELGYDMTNEVYLHPKNLKEKHDEMVKEKNARSDELYIAAKMQQYTDVAKRYKKLCKKYNFSSEGYVIRPAKDAEEIIMEGRILHHCVGRDQYLNKHNKGETVILLLRREDEPNKPYYTIEIKDKKILQWYGLRDKKPDREIIEPWLEKYVEYLKGGLKTVSQEVLQAAG